MLTRPLQADPRSRMASWLDSWHHTRGGIVKGIALIVLGGLVLAAAAVVGPAALAGGKPRDDGARVTRADLFGVNFVENCRYSHQAPDDPIVFPGQPGASHQHTF